MFSYKLPNRFCCRAMLGVAMVLGVTIAAGAAEPSVPYVPTPQEVVERMLEIAKVGPQDYLIDLGSGDGRIVVTAAKKFGARGFGVDLNPGAHQGERRERGQGRRQRPRGIPSAQSVRNRFERRHRHHHVSAAARESRICGRSCSNLKPGTRVVSHDFSMDDWKPDAFVDMDVKEKYGSAGGDSSIYFWIVPARVAGAWQWQLTVGGKPQAYELMLEQKFQMISGTVRVGGRSVRLQDAKLRGDQISFSFSAEVNGSPLEHGFSGRVTGNTIEGTASLAGSRSQGQFEWNATRGAKTGQSGACRDAEFGSASRQFITLAIAFMEMA